MSDVGGVARGGARDDAGQDRPDAAPPDLPDGGPHDEVVDRTTPARTDVPRPPGTVRITPCADGPLLVRGPVEVVGPDGEVVPARRRTVALCRCGGTATPPWCDGTHKVNGFRTTA